MRPAATPTSKPDVTSARSLAPTPTPIPTLALAYPGRLLVFDAGTHGNPATLLQLSSASLDPVVVGKTPSLIGYNRWLSPDFASVLSSAGEWVALGSSREFQFPARVLANLNRGQEPRRAWIEGDAGIQSGTFVASPAFGRTNRQLLTEGVRSWLRGIR